MKSTHKLALALLGGAAILALTVGLAAFGFTSTARANAAVGQTGINHRGGPQPFPGMPGLDDSYLAEALGISVEELRSARTTAYEAAIDQALADGLITQAQADELKSGTGAGRGMRGFVAGFVFGPDSGLDQESFLAKALGISVEELTAAREEAQAARLAQAVADGLITQEAADLIAARQALQAYIDPQAIMAEALGISTDTLQTYQDEGLSLSEILSQAGLTASEYVAARQAAYEAALQEAVSDGVITQAQADQFILAGGWGRLGGRGGPGGFGIRPDRGGFPGFQNMPAIPGSSTTPPGTDANL